MVTHWRAFTNGGHAYIGLFDVANWHTMLHVHSDRRGRYIRYRTHAAAARRAKAMSEGDAPDARRTVRTPRTRTSTGGGR